MKKILQKLFITIFLCIVSCFLLINFYIDQWNSGLPFITILLLSIVMTFLIVTVTRILFLRPLRAMRRITAQFPAPEENKAAANYSADELDGLAQCLHRMSADMQRWVKKVTRDKNELQAILSSMVEGVIVVGSDEKVIILSSPVCDMLDLRSKEVIGKPYWEVIRHDDINSLIKEALMHQKAVKREMAILTLGRENNFSIQTSPIWGASGNLFAVVAVFHDITELKNLERVRTEFVANVSHEVKTPLTSIKGFAETLRDGALEDPRNAKHFLGIIANHTDRLEKVLNDLLCLSSIESKETKMNLERMNVVHVIESILSLYSDRVKDKHMQMTINLPSDLPLIRADRAKMDQVFLNLIDNAIKYTPHGGRMSISAGTEEGCLRIDIQDSGIGIEQKHLPRLFERFYRVDKARSRELGGTGLGLAIVKHIVKAHQGKVLVDSDLGKGSTFSVFLPNLAEPEPRK